METEAHKEITVNLFRNTGHHYHYEKLIGFNSENDEDSEEKNEAGEKILKEVEDFYPCAKESTWTVFKGNGIVCPWLRFRIEEEGIRLCVETNFGTNNRNVHWEKGKRGEGEIPPEEPTPYVAESETRNLCLGVNLCGLKVNFKWQEMGGKDPLDIDLIVDFGNTRTAVLALERRKEIGRDKLIDCCKPILLLRHGEEFEGETPDEENCSDLSRKIVDSWFVLREPEFSYGSEDTFSVYRKGENKVVSGWLWSKKEIPTWTEERVVPQMFVEISPTVMGEECETRLQQANTEEGAVFSMSSPKRFLWEDEETIGREGKAHWSMLSREADYKYKTLEGEICRYTYENGRDWDIEHPPFENALNRPTRNPIHPGYPRRETMVWSALAILENAYREITSFKWRERNDPGIIRRIKTISLTYPSGWVADELKAYKRAWERAADIFSLSRFENPSKERPEIKLEIDEAVASQLPFVHSEIKRTGGSVSKWIKNSGREDSVRVMTIDIGGGTMDVSVVEYWDRYSGYDTIPGANLDCKLLFRDCNTNGGDLAVRKIIERVLLPQIFEKSSAFRGVENGKKLFKEIFTAYSGASADMQMRSRITKLVFVSIVKKWLSALGSGKDGDVCGKTLAELAGDSARNALEDLKAILEKKVSCEGEVLATDEALYFDKEKIEDCIKVALLPGILPIAKLIGKLDIDYVTISGKISELRVVKDLVVKTLKFPESQLIAMKNYPAGDWYPMAEGGRIKDAKTVTVVGAALQRAFKQNLIDDWKVRSVDADESNLNVNCWGFMKSRNAYKIGDGGFQGKAFLTEKDEKSDERAVLIMGDGCRIGRLSLFSKENPEAHPEQIYILRWKDEARRKSEDNGRKVYVAFERVRSDLGESLNLLSARAENEDEGSIALEDLELKLYTLEKERYWIDEGVFEEVKFSDESEA